MRTPLLSLAAFLELTATAMVFRRSCGLTYVLIRIKIKLLFAIGTAEVVRVPLVLRFSCGCSHIYVHATLRIFHSCSVPHYHFSFVCGFGTMVAQWSELKQFVLSKSLPRASRNVLPLRDTIKHKVQPLVECNTSED